MEQLHKTDTGAGPSSAPCITTVFSIVATLETLTAEDCRVIEYHATRIAAQKEQDAVPEAERVEERAGEVERRRLGTWTYVLQRVCCGKASCKACGGTAYKHGPYWYAYRKIHGKMHSKYVGAKFYPVAADGTVLKS